MTIRFGRFSTLLLLGLAGVLAAQAGEIVVQDDLGRTVSLPRPAKRIVSLAPSLTESLFAVGAGDRVAGRTDFCDTPAEARRVPSIGGMINPSIESIIARTPDLVVVSMEGNLREDYQRLLSLGIPVFVSNPRTLEGIYRSLGQLALLSGCDAGGKRLVDSLRAKESALRSRIPRTRSSVLLLVSIHPLMAAGANTLLDNLLAISGGINLAAPLRGHYPAISREAVLAGDPETILLTSEVVGSTSELTTLFPEWSRLRAMRLGRIHRVDANIISRPGPRALQGLELLITLLHGTTP